MIITNTNTFFYQCRYTDKAIPRAHSLYGYYDHQKTASSKTENENEISQRYQPFWPSDGVKGLTDNEHEANNKSAISKEEMEPLDDAVSSIY